MLYEVITLALPAKFGHLHRPGAADGVVLQYDIRQYPGPGQQAEQQEQGDAFSLPCTSDAAYQPGQAEQRQQHEMDIGEQAIAELDRLRITSYNVCYTKLLRSR